MSGVSGADRTSEGRRGGTCGSGRISVVCSLWGSGSLSYLSLLLIYDCNKKLIPRSESAFLEIFKTWRFEFDCNASPINFAHWVSRLFYSRLSVLRGGFILIIAANIFASSRPNMLSGSDKCVIFSNSTDLMAQRMNKGPLSISSYLQLVIETFVLKLILPTSDWFALIWLLATISWLIASERSRGIGFPYVI